MNCGSLPPNFASDGRPGNPFATRYTRPGAIPPLDRRGCPIDIAALIARLDGLEAAALEAPHGHGKSTLLLALAAALGAMGRPVTMVRVRGWRDAWAACHAVVAAPRRTAVFIDGWEQLGLLAAPLRAAARVLRRTLLVTSHRSTGLPLLRACETTPDLLRAIVARLPDRGGPVDEADIAAAFRRHGGNLRESLYDLYDRVERR
jgi:hypothetical protein